MKASGNGVMQVAVPGGARAVELITSATEPVLAGGDAPPAYDDAAVRTFRSGLDTLVAVRHLAGVDHAASLMSPAGAAAAAGLIAAALR